MKIQACLSSNNEHYLTPTEITRPMRRLLVPKGSGRTLIDLATNAAAINAGLVRADFTCDGTPDGGDGLTVDASVADCWFSNHPYGTKIKAFTRRAHELGRGRGMPGISVTPFRGSSWAHEYIFGSADAWLIADKRFVFWRPIPIRQLPESEFLDLPEGKREAARERYLRAWFYAADEEELPPPFRCIGENWAVGPELKSLASCHEDDVTPWQGAPFDTMIAFWADPRDYGGPVLPVALGQSFLDQTADGRWVLSDLGDEQDEREVSERFAHSWIKEFGTPPRKPADHPITVREFVRHFGHLGTIVVARGPYAGVYRKRSS